MLLAEAGFYVNTANAEAVTAVNDTYRLNVKAGISFYNWEIVSLATCRNQNKQEQVDVCVCPSPPLFGVPVPPSLACGPGESKQRWELVVLGSFQE